MHAAQRLSHFPPHFVTSVYEEGREGVIRTVVGWGAFVLAFSILATGAAYAHAQELEPGGSFSEGILQRNFPLEGEFASVSEPGSGNVSASKVGEESNFAVRGVVVSALFYQHLEITVSGGETFDGDGGGLSVPGGGALWGTLFTRDLQRLYDETVSFEFNAAGLFVNVNFFDKDGILLGHVESGAVSTAVGIGGGTGRWHIV